MDYSVTAGAKDVGKVSMVRDGLYYRISCRAQLYGAVLYRLVAMSNGRRESIGILTPVGTGWGLDRKIPCSHLKEEGLQFLLLPSHEPLEGKFVPISPEEPFQYLEKLKDAYLKRQNSRIGVVIPGEGPES